MSELNSDVVVKVNRQIDTAELTMTFWEASTTSSPAVNSVQSAKRLRTEVHRSVTHLSHNYLQIGIR